MTRPRIARMLARVRLAPPLPAAPCAATVRLASPACAATTITYAGLTGSLAPLTITGLYGIMTYGSTPPATTPSCNGFVNGDGPGTLTAPPTCSTTATSSSPAGAHPSDCSGAADPDHHQTLTMGRAS